MGVNPSGGRSPGNNDMIKRASYFKPAARNIPESIAWHASLVYVKAPVSRTQLSKISEEGVKFCIRRLKGLSG